MKKVLLFCALICALWACNNEHELSPNETTSLITIAVDQIAPVFDCEGGTKTITFIAEDNWNASIIDQDNHDWLTITPICGEKGENSIFIIVKANSGTDERTAIIEILCGKAKKQILVTQKQKNAIVLTRTRYNVTSQGEVIAVEVQANIDYVVKIDDNCTSWIQLQQTKALLSSSVSLVIDANLELSPREGHVMINSGGISETIYIYQDGGAPSITITNNEILVPSNGDVITVNVRHNVPVICVIPEGITWITIVDHESVETGCFKFSVAANTSINERDAQIRFTNNENELNEYVTIIQMQQDAIVVSKNEYELDDKGGNIVVTLGHNIDYDIEIDGNDWITVLETKAFVQEEITINVSPNTTRMDRLGHIKFISKDKSKEQEITIKQKPVYTFVLDTKTYVVSSEGGEFNINLFTNTELSVRSTENWLHCVQAISPYSTMLNCSADSNDTPDNRESDVIINSQVGVSDTLHIIQRKKNMISVDKNSFIIGAQGGIITIHVLYNIDYYVSIGSSWIDEVKSKSLVDAEHRFSIAANSTGSNRTGVITFSSYDGTLSQTIEVIQLKDGIFQIHVMDITSTGVMLDVIGSLPDPFTSNYTVDYYYSSLFDSYSDLVKSGAHMNSNVVDSQYQINLNNLCNNTTYYFVAVATEDDNVYQSEVQSLVTTAGNNAYWRSLKNYSFTKTTEGGKDYYKPSQIVYVSKARFNPAKLPSTSLYIDVNFYSEDTGDFSATYSTYSKTLTWSTDKGKTSHKVQDTKVFEVDFSNIQSNVLLKGYQANAKIDAVEIYTVN